MQRNFKPEITREKKSIAAAYIADNHNVKNGENDSEEELQRGIQQHTAVEKRLNRFHYIMGIAKCIQMAKMMAICA